MAIVKREHGIGRVRTRDTNSNQFPFLEVIGPLRSPFKVKCQTIPGVRNDRRARQISPTRQKLRDCTARRTSILSSSHCRCCQPRRVPPSLSAKSCDAPLARIGAAVGIPTTEGRGLFWQKEAKFLNEAGAACKKGVAGASSDNGNGGYLGHLLFGISPFLAKHSMQNLLRLWHGAFVGHNRPAPD